MYIWKGQDFYFHLRVKTLRLVAWLGKYRLLTLKTLPRLKKLHIWHHQKFQNFKNFFFFPKLKNNVAIPVKKVHTCTNMFIYGRI